MELRIAQSALEDLQAIQAYYKSRMCHISVMISWLLSWSTVKYFKSTPMLDESCLNSTWILFEN